MDSRNIVLVGFMGTGKSTVGKILARRLGRTWVDVDQRIEEAEKRKIADIFEKDGESAFRRMEKEMVSQVAGGANLVITTGGGVVLDAENMKALKANGVLVALAATVETVHQRVKDSRHRPLLNLPAGQAGTQDMQSEIQRLLEARKPHYDRADLKCATDGKTAQQVADEILRTLAHDGEFEFGKDWF